jgi:hypothetical protein
MNTIEGVGRKMRPQRASHSSPGSCLLVVSSPGSLPPAEPPNAKLSPRIIRLHPSLGSYASPPRLSVPTSPEGKDKQSP